MNSFRSGSVNTHWARSGKHKFRAKAGKHKLGGEAGGGAGLVNRNWGLGPVNTNWGPGPVNTNWGPGLGAGTGARVGGREIQIPLFQIKRSSH